MRNSRKKNFYPVGLDLHEKQVLIVGGGRLALREAGRLIDCGAYIDLVARLPLPEVKELALTHSHRLRVLSIKPKEVTDEKVLSGYCMVFAYIEDQKERRAVVEAARRAGVMVTEPDGDGDFQIPRWIKRGHVKIAVSADGLSSSLEKALINRIEAETCNDLDGYCLYLEFVEDRISTLPMPINPRAQELLVERLKDLSDSAEIERAIKRNSFQEAERLFETKLEQLLQDCLGEEPTLEHAE